MTKKEAIDAAKKLRAQGKTVKILKHEGVYTRPGVGMVGYVHYSLKVE